MFLLLLLDGVVTSAATITLAELDSREVRAGRAGVHVIGTVRPVDRPLQTEWVTTGDGCVATSAIVSPRARQIRARLASFAPPAVGEVFVYSLRNRGDVHGPYGAEDRGELWTPPVDGDGIAIEYRHPGACGADEELPFTVDAVSHVYGSAVQAFAQSCHRDVPADWGEIAKSVVLLQSLDHLGEYICSGVLLGTALGDETPYVLTANHCIDTQEEAKRVRAVFRFERPNQSVASLPRSDEADLLLTNVGLDYSLLLMKGAVPEEQVAWAGWHSGTIWTPQAAFALHHPGSPLADAYTRFAHGTIVGGNASLYRVDWLPGGGVVENGSSGSGIWLRSGYLAGVLSAGPEDECDDPNGYLYARFDAVYDDITRRSNPSYVWHGPHWRRAFSEVNRSCSWCIPPGTYDRHVVTRVSEFFTIHLRSGASARVTASFVHRYGDVDLALYRGFEAWRDDGRKVIATSSGSSNQEVLAFTNESREDAYFTVGVHLASGTRNVYTIDFRVSSDCWYALSPSSDYGHAGGGSGVLYVVGAPAGCTGSWSASSKAPWLYLTGTANGTGSGLWRVPYAYDRNPSTNPYTSRTGRIEFAAPELAERPFALQQASLDPSLPACTFTVQPGQRARAEGGLHSIAAVFPNIPPFCQGGSWTVTGTVPPWMKLLKTFGTGSSSWSPVEVWLEPNPNATSRQATVTVAGTAITVVQDPPREDCAYAVASEPVGIGGILDAERSMANAALSGGTGAILITGGPPGCSGSWSASSDAPWLSLTGTRSGSGSGNWRVPYAYEATTEPRAAYILLGGDFSPAVPRFRLYQLQRQTWTCSYAPDPASVTAPASGTTGRIEIRTTGVSSCAGSWSASTDAAWLTLTGRTSGNQAGAIDYAVAPNSGPTRTGRIYAARGVVTVTQDGATSSIAIRGGDAQTIAVHAAFAPLQVLVRDAANRAKAGAAVTFAVASGDTGAAGAFASTVPVTTDAAGIATAPSLTANGMAGTFHVFASTPGTPAAARFTLTNTAPPVAPPAAVSATTTTALSITISWTPGAGATLYEISRSAAATPAVLLGTTSATTFTDSTVLANRAYVYSVRSAAPRRSAPAAPELATTFAFADLSLPGATIRVDHVAELRSAVNEVRALAGLAPAVFPDASLTARTSPIRASHVLELRTALDPARAALGLPALAYARPSLAVGVSAVRAADLEELRGGVR